MERDAPYKLILPDSSFVSFASSRLNNTNYSEPKEVIEFNKLHGRFDQTQF